MKIEINSTKMWESAFAGSPMNNEEILITKKGMQQSHSEIFETIHHELRHAKQHECLYHSDPNRFWTKIYEGITHIQFNDFDKYKSFIQELKEKVGSTDFSKKEVQNYIDKNIANVSKIIDKNFGKPDINNIPENYRKTVDNIWRCSGTTIHYPQRMEEIDAIKIGNMMRELVFG